MSDPKVMGMLQGRLGNNLFIVATTAAYAKRHGLTWAIPLAYTHKEIYDWGLPTSDKHENRTYWKQPEFAYVPIPEFPPGTRLWLDGFFQSPKYFEDRTDYVRQVIVPKQVARTPAVSIHVRRTDFLSYGDCFRVLPLRYYETAIGYFAGIGQRHFMVFSDDLKWCAEHLPGLVERTHFQFCEERDARTAMSLMAGCTNHIIANSSFSWWGAWLNPRPKLVVCPAHDDWFGNRFKCAGTKDLYPDSWVQVPAGDE